MWLWQRLLRASGSGRQQAAVSPRSGEWAAVPVSYNVQTLPLSFSLLLWLGQHCANKAENCIFYSIFCVFQSECQQKSKELKKYTNNQMHFTVQCTLVHVLKWPLAFIVARVLFLLLFFLFEFPPLSISSLRREESSPFALSLSVFLHFADSLFALQWLL